MTHLYTTVTCRVHTVVWTWGLSAACITDNERGYVVLPGLRGVHVRRTIGNFPSHSTWNMIFVQDQNRSFLSERRLLSCFLWFWPKKRAIQPKYPEHKLKTSLVGTMWSVSLSNPTISGEGTTIGQFWQFGDEKTGQIPLNGEFL